MSEQLKERIYRVLLVSASSAVNEAISALVKENACYLLTVVPNLSEAKRIAAERRFDFSVINSPLPDGTGERFAVDLCSSGDTVVLFLARSEVHEQMHDALCPYGVLTLARPTSRAMLTLCFALMEGVRERLRFYGKKAQTVEEKMEEIRLVNRAKWTLIEKRGMSEPEAHRFIEKTAMDLCVTKKEIAQRVLCGEWV